MDKKNKTLQNSKQLLTKYFAGDASQDEKEAVQLWLEADKNNRKAFLSLRSLYDITLGHLPEEENKTFTLKNKRRKLVTALMKMAAAVLITFSCTYYFFQRKEQPSDITSPISMQTLYVPAGQRAELTLTDGTKVWLNSLTTFTFPDHFTETSRDVYLDGEGYFDVIHDEKRLFNVNTKEYVVKVLGTEFNVLAYHRNNFFETSLIDGAVEVMSNHDQQNILLTPGNRVYSENNRLTSAPIPDYDHFLWKKGIISFDNERVEDMLKKLEIYYDVRIENRNKQINDMRYTGKFRTKDGIEHVLNVLQVPTGLHYKKDSENNIIHMH